MSMLRPFFRVMSPPGRGARLSVLIFHRVLREQDPLFPGEMYAQRFNLVCKWLKLWFNILPLDTAVAQLKAGTLPARAACITFDDGYADNYQVALPILQRHGMTASFFIATGFIDGGRMWNDTIIESIRSCKDAELDISSLGLGQHLLGSNDQRRNAIAELVNQIKYRAVDQRITLTEQLAHLAGVQPPRNLMMTSAEVMALRRAGMQIGAHTVTHPILARLSDAQVLQEIEDSRSFLESLLEERVGLFAYPNGKPGEDYSPQCVDIVRNLGFDAAVSTQWGSSSVTSDMFQLRRFTPWDTSRLRFGARLLANLRSA
jgi:peptidoglycan/xylan/chitin deacetylase (PgdA/CDA1 family)